jgi:hypothetical protein
MKRCIVEAAPKVGVLELTLWSRDLESRSQNEQWLLSSGICDSEGAKVCLQLSGWGKSHRATPRVLKIAKNQTPTPVPQKIPSSKIICFVRKKVLRLGD